MARKLRVEYPGAIYHPMSRGDHGERIFRDDSDRKSFLDTLHAACDKTGWQVHAFCLRSNHFHLVLETPQGNLVDYRKLRRGWCFGPATFRQELLAQMREQLGQEHFGPERYETMENRAEEIVVEELKRRRWPPGELEKRRKGDSWKLAIALRLRAETEVTVKWIADRLLMGAPGYLNYLLYLNRNPKKR